MTSEQYYAPAYNKIREMKNAGKDPYKKAFDYLVKATNEGKCQFTVWENKSKKQKLFDLTIKPSPFGFDIFYGDGSNGVEWLKLSNFSYPTMADTAKCLTIELLGLAYNPDIAFKQFMIDIQRAEGMDV